jgi:hypothetical protein
MQGNYGIDSCNIIAWHLDNIVEVKTLFLKLDVKVTLVSQFTQFAFQWYLRVFQGIYPT